MSTKAGLKNYTVYVTDVSGNALTGISAGWLITGKVNTDIITSGTVSEISDGFYFAVVDTPPGTGFIKISHSNSAYIITPSYFVVDDNINDTDDLYAQQSIINANVNAVKSIVSTLRIGSSEAAGCFCLGPPGASQPPFTTDRLVAMVYPKIFNYTL
jgi:hypothetical protein